MHLALLDLWFFVGFLQFIVFVMAAVSLTPEEKTVFIEKANPEFFAMLTKRDIDDDFIAKLVKINVNSIDVFAAFAQSEDDLYATLKKYFEIDPDDLMGRVKASKIVVAWQYAKTRTVKIMENDGENEVRQRPKDVPLEAMVAMHEAYEKAYWIIEEDRQPARSYMERKLDEIEKTTTRPNRWRRLSPSARTTPAP